MKNTYLIAPICLLLASCGGLNEPAPANLSGVQTVSLNSAQQKLVSDGVREMVAKETVSGGEDAKLSNFKAFSLLPGSSVHVCGDVSYQLEPGEATKSASYYLEFTDQNGALEAIRGQVGFDVLKKSKVTFMCRHVNTG